MYAVYCIISNNHISNKYTFHHTRKLEQTVSYSINDCYNGEFYRDTHTTFSVDSETKAGQVE